MALDPSFEPDPDLGGSYYRRLEDIRHALTKFEVTALPTNSPAQFVAYYFGAEKLAKAVAGILGRGAAEKAFEFVPVNPTKIKSAVEPMGLHISDTDIDALFVRDKNTKQPDTAIEIRNRLFHDFGPTQVCHVWKHAARLVPIMVKFIRDDIDPVLKHLQALWAAQAQP